MVQRTAILTGLTVKILLSANVGQLASYEGRSFAYAGPSNWNSLHFLLTLETVVFLFHLLSTTSKPFSSLSTKLANAARLGFFYKKNALYKFPVIIIDD